MVPIVIQAVKTYLESQGIRYTDIEDNIISISFDADNVSSVRFAVFFDNDGESIHIQSIGYVKIPSEKLHPMYRIMNDLNRKFRWAKFSIDDDGDVIVEDDAIIDLESAGEEVFQEIIHLVQIADDAYPVIQKAIWA